MAADTRAGSVAAGAAAAAVGTGTRSGRSSLKAEALETGKLLAAGGIAGAVSKSATAPLARLTILYQASSSAIAEPNGGMQTTAIRPCLLLPPANYIHAISLVEAVPGQIAAFPARCPCKSMQCWCS